MPETVQEVLGKIIYRDKVDVRCPNPRCRESKVHTISCPRDGQLTGPRSCDCGERYRILITD